MEQLQEIHDPDYPEAPAHVKEESPSLINDEKFNKIRSIVHREFTKELEAREGEVRLLDQRMTSARRLLHRLRYSLVSSYFKDQKLQLSTSHIHDDIALQRDPKAKEKISHTLRESQRGIHPSLKKLLGKESVDIEEIFRTRAPRNKTRKDYSAMVQKRNYTIPSDSSTSLRPPTAPSDTAPATSDPSPASSAPASPSPQPARRVPRALKPKLNNVVTLEASRNHAKHRYRFIIGNTSKYVPAASLVDRSTHKWLLYVRGAPPHADPSPLLSGLHVTLHHSYAPHHTVQLTKHPFHITRRGWGEFPAKIELQFALPELNRPATVEHNITLDRNYTGMQTLGSETIVDVWLYSNAEMLKYEYQEDEHILPDKEEQTNTQTNIQTNSQTEQTPIKEEPKEFDSFDQSDNWMDFFKTPTELDVDEMFLKPYKQDNIDMNQDIDIKQEVDTMDIDFEEQIDDTQKVAVSEDKSMESILQVPNEILSKPLVKKRIVKYMDPTTGKIFYLEMDRELDLTKVQEIIINDTATKISPIISNGLKNVRKRKGVSLLKPEVKSQVSLLKPESKSEVKQIFPHLENDHCYTGCYIPKEAEIPKEENLYESLVAVMHRFPDVRSAVNYLVRRLPLISTSSPLPFCRPSERAFFSLDPIKRRNIEWSRAKLINKILLKHFIGPKPAIWRTKQILLYLRLHGHTPEPPEGLAGPQAQGPQAQGARAQGAPAAEDICSKSVFTFDMERLSTTPEPTEDEIIYVTSSSPPPVPPKPSPLPPSSPLEQLPVSREDRLRFLYVENACADVGVELKNEDIGHGREYSAVHAVLLSAMRSFCEELIRCALAERRKQNCPALSVWNSWPPSPPLSVREVWRAALRGRLRALSARDAAARSATHHAI